MQLEKHYLKLKNYLLTEKLEGHKVQAICLCSSPNVQDTIRELMISNDKIDIKLIGR